MKMTLSYRYLNTNLGLLAGFGFSREKSLSLLKIGEDAFKNPDARLSVDPFLELLNFASEAIGDPQLALRVGHKFRVATFAETGSVYGYCKNLEAVIKMNDQYQKLAIDVGKVTFVQNGPDQNFMVFAPYYDDMERYRPITDVIMGAYFAAYHWLSWGSGEEILGVQLPYAAPENLKTHEAIYQIPIQFSAKQTSLQFSDIAMADTLMSYNPERLVRIKKRLDNMIGQGACTKSFDTSVNAAILAAIKNGHITSHVVADRMGLTWSAFRTALKRSGPTFRDRVDAVRQGLFHEYLAEGQSFSQIALGLAYNDQPAMNRAFRRWYGMTPSQWKAARHSGETRASVDTQTE